MNSLDKTENVALSLIKENLERGKTSNFLVDRASMLPFLRPGDSVSVVRVRCEDLRVGDVVVFEFRGQLIAHRMIQFTDKNHSRIVTKGDNNVHFDKEEIFDDKLIGKITSIKRDGKTVVLHGRLWRAIHYLSAILSRTQADSGSMLAFLRRVCLNNRRFDPGAWIRDVLFFLLIMPAKLTVRLVQRIGMRKSG